MWLVKMKFLQLRKSLQAFGRYAPKNVCTTSSDWNQHKKSYTHRLLKSLSYQCCVIKRFNELFQADCVQQNVSNEEICPGKAVFVAVVGNWQSLNATYNVVLECVLYYTTESFSFAVLMLVAAHYCLDLYPEKIPATFEFIQKGLLGINQHERFKKPKVRTLMDAIERA